MKFNKGDPVVRKFPPFIQGEVLSHKGGSFLVKLKDGRTDVKPIHIFQWFGVELTDDLVKENNEGRIYLGLKSAWELFENQEE